MDGLWRRTGLKITTITQAHRRYKSHLYLATESDGNKVHQITKQLWIKSCDHETSQKHGLGVFFGNLTTGSACKALPTLSTLLGNRVTSDPLSVAELAHYYWLSLCPQLPFFKPVHWHVDKGISYITTCRNTQPVCNFLNRSFGMWIRVFQI